MADEAQDTIQMDTTYGAGGQAVEDGQEALEKVANKHAHQEIKELTQKQKAALVIVAMGSDRASKIYKYLNEVDIEDITYEVARLGKTTNQQVEDTLDEFYKLCLTHKMMTDGGLDYARSVLGGLRRYDGEEPPRQGIEDACFEAFQLLLKGRPEGAFVAASERAAAGYCTHHVLHGGRAIRTGA